MADSHCLVQIVRIRCNSRDLLVANVYIPPASSTEIRACQWNYLNTIISRVEVKHPDAWFLFSGDWNARVGSHFEVFKQVDNLNDLPENCLIRHSSKDLTINASGRLLAKFCTTFGLVNLDNEGDFTFLAPHGASVIDYILVSLPLLLDVIGFNVGPPFFKWPFAIQLYPYRKPEFRLATPSLHIYKSPIIITKIKWDTKT